MDHLYSGFGKIFVLSAPSGSGKTTLVRELKRLFPDLEESISFTTRPQRVGEQDGVDYHFVSRREFEEMQKNGAFVEWAEVHGNLYGTAAQFMEEIVRDNRFAICDIDFQGALHLKERFGDAAVLIFVLPPSMAELERRLRGRKTDDNSVIITRLENARQEVNHFTNYRYIVVNDYVSSAIRRLQTIVDAEKNSSITAHLPIIRSLLHE